MFNTGNLDDADELFAPGVVWFRIAQGKSVEHWGEFDALGLMQQLGVISASGQG